MFALVDCNNFYVSCERLFRPDLKGKPVVVLSNNDGCAVARSQEVKQLGVPMGIPWFQMQALAQRHHIVAFSSNYALYADISGRVMRVLRDMVPHSEVYSIDESFIDLSGIEDRQELGYQIRQRIGQWVGIPVCVGIGSTKTRAKLANHIAKKHTEFEGVFDLEAQTSTQQSDWLKRLDASDVWGIGRQLKQQLETFNIHTAYDLQHADVSWIKKRFSIHLARTVEELRGHACLKLQAMVTARQQIMVSRSLGVYVTQEEELRQSVISHAARASEKLRKDGSVTHAVMVFIQTNPYRQQDDQYTASQWVPLVTPSQDSRCIIAAAIRGLQTIYRPGYRYKKTGVMLSDLSPADVQQGDLFDPGADDRRQRLMLTLDTLNHKLGRDTLFFAGQGVRQRWHMRRDLKSPAYTTDFNDLPRVSG